MQGQFDTVLQEELAQILEAFKKLSTKARGSAYRPSLSIIICGCVLHHVQLNLECNAFPVLENGITRGI